MRDFLPDSFLRGVRAVDRDLLEHPFLSDCRSNTKGDISASGFALVAHQAIKNNVEFVCP
jgi:hypothetical protein